MTQEIAILENQLEEPKNTPSIDIFQSNQSFALAQQIAKMLASSSLVPEAYRNNAGNTMIALEMAQRIGASPMAVMQNLHVIHGKPSWSSAFIIAAMNSCGRFSQLRFDTTTTDSCKAWAYDKETQEKLEGPLVTMKMAEAEGWISKKGSKWKTMPELMLRYRAAAFFGRLYAPDILMGMKTEYETTDIHQAQSRNQTSAVVSQVESIVASGSAAVETGTADERDNLVDDLDQISALAIKLNLDPMDMIEKVKRKGNGEIKAEHVRACLDHLKQKTGQDTGNK